MTPNRAVVVAGSARAAMVLASDAAADTSGHILGDGFLAAGLTFPLDPAKDRPIGALG